MCRRASEYELNRVQGLLRRAQQKLQDAGLKAAVAPARFKPDEDRAVPFWREEITRLEGELVRLLATDIASQESNRAYPHSA